MATVIAIVTSLRWVQCNSIGLFTVGVSDSDIPIAKSGMGVAPKFSVSDPLCTLYKSLSLTVNTNR